ncbi:MAG: 3-hydroxyacyl-CoA dehydrogenase [Lentisphaeria bacterium]|nr:3-hydroxyacyl-CoA dehydrogenase [Lentisphaeria bacterium]
MSKSFNKVTLLGGGVLGGQIAWHSAFRGKQVVVYDAFAEGLEKCKQAHQTYSGIYAKDLNASEEELKLTFERLSYSGDLKDAVHGADIIIECVPENPDIKIKLYDDLSPLLSPQVILATNSSSLLPSQFSEHVKYPENYCALHFANLVWALNIAEIMAHKGTSKETLVNITRFAIEIGMVPIPVQKERNGYVCNSLLIPIIHTALTLLNTGVTTPDVLDRTYMIMNRGTSMGPCGIMDIVGFKTVYDINQYWGEVNQDEQMLSNADYVKKNFIDKGILGLQTGQGFYSYPDPMYASPDFLEVPDVSKAKEIASLAVL